MQVNLNLNQPYSQKNNPSFKMNIKGLVPDLNATIGASAAKDMVKKFKGFGYDSVHLYCEEFLKQNIYLSDINYLQSLLKQV